MYLTCLNHVDAFPTQYHVSDRHASSYNNSKPQWMKLNGLRVRTCRLHVHVHVGQEELINSCQIFLISPHVVLYVA